MNLQDEAGDRTLHPQRVFPVPLGLTNKEFTNIRDIAIKANKEQLQAVIGYLASELDRRSIYEEVN